MQFIDLATQQSQIREALDLRIAAVLDHGKYIMGPEVAELEQGLSAFCGSSKNAISCSNGTDAISLVLMAMNIGEGDAVFCPSFTFAATAETIALQKASPVFVDVCEDTYNMDLVSLKKAYQVALDGGLKPKAVMTVDLFGQPADYDGIEAFCAENDLKLICDAAQGFGGQYKGRSVGSIGTATTTSFFPAKPLGCYGDGGAVFCEDEEIRSVMESLRVHGKGSDKYDNVRIGLNARLDTMQAAILLEKLAIFPREVEMRNTVADRYREQLSSINSIVCPTILDGVVSSWAQYTIQVDAGQREAIMSGLKERGIPSVIYYPKPLHQQTAYSHYPSADELPVTNALAKKVMSLPMHPYLTNEDQDKICDAMKEVVSEF